MLLDLGEIMGPSLLLGYCWGITNWRIFLEGPGMHNTTGNVHVVKLTEIHNPCYRVKSKHRWYGRSAGLKP
jgi:hypothetical protein